MFNSNFNTVQNMRIKLLGGFQHKQKLLKVRKLLIVFYLIERSLHHYKVGIQYKHSTIKLCPWQKDYEKLMASCMCKLCLSIYNDIKVLISNVLVLVLLG